MGPPPSYERTERGEVTSKVYGIWVDRGRGVVVSPTILLPMGHYVSTMELMGLGFALLDVSGPVGIL